MAEKPEIETSVLPGTLYVVATPIGHLDDVSRRAVDVLGNVATIAAEDTRRTLTLLNALGIPRPNLVALHEHNEQAASDAIVARLTAGESVALVSDAGTPVLSDPGFTLIRRCYEIGVPVRPVPGPSAVTAAMSVCPLPLSGVRFVGFLPARSGPRQSALKALLASGGPSVFFEAPHRLRDCLLDLQTLAPDRRVFVAREMTKRFETYLVGLPQALIAEMDRADQWRGEVVCILEGEGRKGADLAEQRRVMGILSEALPPAQAARIGAQILGVRKKDLYGMTDEDA